MNRTLSICVWLVFFLSTSIAAANPYKQPVTQKENIFTLKLYLDCRSCYKTYIKTELTFVSYVRNRQDADVHVLITRQRTGSGGREYTLTFIGHKRFKGMADTLRSVSGKTDTDDEIRQRLTQMLKLGLMRFVAKTSLADEIKISYAKLKEEEVAPVEDKWNYWVISLSARGFFRGEKSSNFLSLNGSVSANRITDDWKIRLRANAGYDENNFTVGEDKISSFSRSYFFFALAVKSLSNHFSAGGFVTSSSSTYDNKKLDITVAPAFEYNLFPYSESTHRELRILYKIGINNVRYIEETIFDKMKEQLYGHELTVTFETRQPWGNAEFSLEGSHLLNDFSKNRLRFSGELRLRLYRGFSLRLDGNISRIRDQLSLPKGEASTEEVLLRRRQLATSYRYYGSVGFTYSFGSIFSNVVNSRFGN